MKKTWYLHFQYAYQEASYSSLSVEEKQVIVYQVTLSIW